MPEFLASIVPGFALDIWNWFPPLWQYLFTVLFKILVPIALVRWDWGSLLPMSSSS